MRAELQLAVIAVLVSCIGCAPAQSAVENDSGDVANYEQYVHPLLEGSCATLDCHGNPGRPLRLYAETGLRIADDLRGPGQDPTMPITDDELAANVASIVGIGRDMVLFKPLSNTGGGIHHKGGQVWSGTDDDAYRCVRSWFKDSIKTEACANAAAEYALPPP